MFQTYMVSKLLSNTGFTEIVKDTNADAIALGYPHMFEGYPVKPEMLAYLTALKESMPLLKFLPNRKRNYAWDKDGESSAVAIFLFHEFFTYLDSNPICLGKVGYWQYGTTKNVQNPERRFMVASRKIENSKYGTSREEYHMALTKDIKTSVRNARKYLVPMTHAEIARNLYGDIKTSVNKVRDVPVSALESLVDKISRMRRVDLMREIRSLTLQGVEFKSQEFQEASNQCVELLDQYEEENRRKIELLFVRVRNVGDEQYVDVSGDLETYATNDLRTYRIDELPQDIAGSIAVLSILEEGQYVARVGRKVDDNMYWIERG